MFLAWDRWGAGRPRRASAARPVRPVAWLRGWVLVAAAVAAGAQAEPAPERQRELLRLVRQECGACHGLHLTGGLGPALTAQALADFPQESIVATILHGRPGTPMPPWSAFITEPEARWMARRLAEGLPAAQARR